MMRGLKGNKKKTLAGGGPGGSLPIPAEVTSQAMDFPPETDLVIHIKKKGKFSPFYNKTRTLVMKSNIVTMKKGEKVKMEIDILTCVTPSFHDKDCKIVIKGKKTCQFRVEREQYQKLKAFVEMILKQDNTPSATVKETEPSQTTTVQHPEHNNQNVTGQEMSQLVKADSTEKKKMTFQWLTDEYTFLESTLKFTFVLQEDIISRELFAEITPTAGMNKQRSQLSIKCIQDEKAIKPEDVVFKPEEKVVRPKDVASALEEKVVKPKDVDSAPEEKVVKPTNVASIHEEKVMKLEDVASKPEAKVMTPKHVASESEEKIMKPDDVASEPNKKVVKPKDVDSAPEEKVVKSKNVASEPEEKVRKPENIASEPEEKVRKPENIASEPEEKVRKPENIASEPEEKVRKPENVAFKSEAKVMTPKHVASESEEKVMKPKNVASEPAEKVMRPEGIAFEPDKNVVKPDDTTSKSDAIVVKPEVVASKYYNCAKLQNMVTTPVHNAAGKVDVVEKSVINEDVPVTASASRQEKRKHRENKKEERKGNKSVIPKSPLKSLNAWLFKKTNGKHGSLSKKTSMTKKENIQQSKKVQRGNLTGSGENGKAFKPPTSEHSLIDTTTKGRGETNSKGELILLGVDGEPTKELDSASTLVGKRRELSETSTVTQSTVYESDWRHSVKKKAKSVKKKVAFVLKKIHAIPDSCKRTLKKVIEVCSKGKVTSTKCTIENSLETETKNFEVEADIPKAVHVCKDKKPIEVPSSSITSCGNGRENPLLKKAIFATTICILFPPVTADNITAASSNNDFDINVWITAAIGCAIILLGENHARLVLEFLAEQLGRFYINGGTRAAWIEVQHDDIYLAPRIVFSEPPVERFIMTLEEEQPPNANNQELVISNRS